MSASWMKPWLTVGMFTVSAAYGETLYQRDGITLEGTVRIEVRGAGVCQVSADQHTAEEFERMKANHGQPLHLWRLAFTARNSSGQRLERLTAQFGIASEAPPCTSWENPQGTYAKPVQWANSIQVLRKPDGMGLGEEVNDTVFVLAFHDQQPKFESWNVDYRFVDEAGREAEPARGSPAFIVVPLPAHATVSLVDAGQPYRRRMPLEPGRYQVEVSAPGYRTHRAWVDHKQTWPHRIELERLPGGDGISTSSVPGSVPGGQLPPDVQVDLNLRKAEQALKDGDAATAREAMERLVSVQQDHGLEPEAEDHFRYAQAWEAAGEPERARASAVRYLQLLGRQAQHYTEALDLMNRAESAQKGPASAVSEADRVVPQVSQRDKSQPTARPEPAIAGAAQAEPVRVPPPAILALQDLRIADQAVQDQDLQTARSTIERLQELGGEHELGPAIEARVRTLQRWLRDTESLEKPGPEIASGDARELGGRASGQADAQATNCEWWTNESEEEAEAAWRVATVETATACLDAGADVSSSSEDGHTPLHRAARYSEDPDIVQALLARRADLNAKATSDGHLPVHEAALNENAAVLEALLAAGVDPMIQDGDGATPLHYATFGNQNEAVTQVLLTVGVDVDARRHDGLTPLHWAAFANENPAVLKALVAAGAKRQGTEDGRTLLHFAAMNNGNPTVIEALIASGENVAAQTEGNRTPLWFAAGRNDNPAILETLLTAGADLEARDEDGDTPLHYAARNNENPAMIKALLAAGAEMAARNEAGRTPLHLAARYNDNPGVVDALFAAWPDLKTLPAPVHGGGTALHLLVRRASAAVLNALLKAGADPEAPNDYGETALHIAATHNRDLPVIKTLIEAGADPNEPGNLGYTPLHAAAESNGNPEVIKTLIEAGADPSARSERGATPLHYAVHNYKNPEVAEAILATGPSPMARDEDGETPLHWAVRFGEGHTVIDRLVAAGADVNARDESGATPLHRAARWNINSAVIDRLVAAGADVNAMDQEGNTPLHNAAAAWSERWYAFESYEQQKPSTPIEMLLDAGADVQARNAAGETMWDIVQGSENLDELKKHDTHWRLNEARFKAPVESALTPRSPALARTTSVPDGRPPCQIPGYPRPANPRGLSLPWCPASVDFQIRVFALQAAGAQCAIATGSSSTADQIQMRRREIDDLCKRLEALDGTEDCRCPAALRP